MPATPNCRHYTNLRLYFTFLFRVIFCTKKREQCRVICARRPARSITWISERKRWIRWKWTAAVPRYWIDTTSTRSRALQSTGLAGAAEPFIIIIIIIRLKKLNKNVKLFWKNFKRWHLKKVCKRGIKCYFQNTCLTFNKITRTRKSNFTVVISKKMSYL